MKQDPEVEHQILSKQMEKMQILQFLNAKRREETWQRAIGTIGLKPTIIKELDRQQIQDSYEPFKSGNVKLVMQGHYKTQKVSKIVLEVMQVEMVGNCY